MAVTAIRNIALEFEIDFNGQPLAFECQVIDVELKLPGIGPGASTETACPGGIVSEVGTASNGSITGNIFVDPTDTGITWALATLYQAGDEFHYSLTYYADQDQTISITFEGQAKVNSFTLPFNKPGMARQPLDLALITATMRRPAALVGNTDVEPTSVED